MRFWFFGNSNKPKFDRSPKWKSVRSEHIKSNGTCAACGKKTDLEVHHIEPVHLKPDRELDPTNLITLCDSYCHLAIGHLMDYRSWNTNVIDDAKVYLDKIKNRPYK